MTREIVLLDLFSGIGGFAKGIEDAGFIIKKHFFSEIDKHAIANYNHNFKNAQYVGPIQDVRGASLGKVDFVAFGSPCQDFSIAGKREGLDGDHSSLILEAIKIIIEKKPSFFIWENVKGTFSSNNGEDFFAILQEFANIRGYNIEWQLLNTLWVLPQNRERIYLVGHLTETLGSFRPVFPFTKNDRLFSIKKGTNERQSQAKHSGTVRNGSLKADDTYIGIPAKSGTLTIGGHSGGLHSDMTVINVERFSNHQQDRIYDTSGAIGCLSKNRSDDKSKIKVPQNNESLTVMTTQPRSGDPKKGGTGFLSKENEAYCLDCGNSQAIKINKDYRRMTEIEHERLQGFPDNWTQFGIYEKQVWINKKEKTFKIVEGIEPIAQTNRYKLIGNAVTTTFPKMIAQKLIENYSL
jgi:DNA (cytosine-5)-methyltransferase 1